MTPTIIFLILSSLVFPLYWIYPFTYYKTVQYFFTLPSISALATALVFLFPQRLYINFRKSIIFFTLLLLFLAIPVTQLYLFDTITPAEFFFSVLWISIPLFGFAYNSELKKALPVYFFIFLLFDVFNSYIQSDQIVGIAGNRNWHAATLSIIIPFSIYFAHSLYLKYATPSNKLKLKLTLWIVFSVTTLISLYIIFLCKTRTIFALLPILALVCLFLELREKYKKLVVGILFLILIIVGSLFFVSFYGSKYSVLTENSAIQTLSKKEDAVKTMFVYNIERDVRGPLWRGCIDLIRQHPYIGVSAPRFESEYQLHRPIEYFLKPDNAVRSNHPHNSFLYIAASYGLPGFVIWFILWTLPVFVCFIRYYKLSVISKIVLFSYTLLYIHALMDLIFFEWPTLFFGAVLIGILWADTLGLGERKKSGEITEKNNTKLITSASQVMPKYLKYPFKLFGLIALIFCILTVYLDTVSSFYFRLGEYSEVDANKQQAAEYYAKGVSYRKDPQYLYKTATTYLLELNNPDKAIYYLSLFQTISLENYAHSNGFMALALVKEKRLVEAMPFLLKEAIIYPLLVGSWYRLSYVQGALGLKNDASVSLTNMMDALKYKNLPQNKRTIYYLLENPTFDAHPDRIPQKTLDMLNAD